MTDVRDLYPSHYRDVIDDETWSFIEATNAHYPPEALDLTIEAQRAHYDRMCSAFSVDHPEGIAVADGSIGPPSNPGPFEDNSLAFRSYTPFGKSLTEAGEQPDALVMFYHGGGFILGGLDSHDDVCAEICARTGFGVIAVDYRLSPESTFPADFHDAMRGLGVAEALDLPTVLCGDSAGGTLAAAVSAHARQAAFKPCGQVLIYPGLSGDFETVSGEKHAEAPMLTRADLEMFKTVRTGGSSSALDDPRASPLLAEDFANLPPTIVFSAECDPLSDHGEAYCDRLNDAGGRAHWINEPGLVHGYLRARHSVERARQSFTRIVDAISMLGRGGWIY